MQSLIYYKVIGKAGIKRTEQHKRLISVLKRKYKAKILAKRALIRVKTLQEKSLQRQNKVI